jgi:alkylated DNA nucleotide flippase Atl1
MRFTPSTLAPIIEALFLKPAPSRPIVPADTLNLIAGEGLEGDAARSLSSPRQVLIVRQEDLDAFDLPRGYLKENLVISGLATEDFQPGKSIEFECGGSIHLTFYCEPCKAIVERVPNLKSIVGRRGILGVVTQSGRLIGGIRVKSTKGELEAMSVSPGERVCAVIARIPRGRVIDYAVLLQAAGLQRVFFRAIPSYLKVAQALDLPAFRVVTSRLKVPDCMPGAAAILATELDLGQIAHLRWRISIVDILRRF